MLEADELDSNPVFRALQTQYWNYFSWAQDKQGLICIPHSRSVRGLDLNREFIEKHVFRPSPLFKDQYITRDDKRPASVAVEEEDLVTLDGYPQQRTTRILSEELGYNKRSESFRILIIDKPLVGAVPIELNEMSFIYDCQSVLTHDESRLFLSRLPGCNQVVDKFNGDVQKFCNNYMILTEFLDDVAEKLNDIWTNTTKTIVDCLGSKLQSSDHAIRTRIQLAVESYLLGRVNDKLFPKICENCESDDRELEKKCHQLKGTTFVQFGIPSDIRCSLDSALVKLDGLEECVCPFEKLICIKEVLDSLTESVKNHVQRNGRSAQNTDLTLLTSDQYIPLLASCIVEQEKSHIASNIYYLDKFQFHSRPSDSLSFSLVTLKAAHSFVLSFQPHVQSSPTTNNQQIERNPSFDQLDDASTTTSDKRPKSKIERELALIARMMPTTTTKDLEINRVQMRRESSREKIKDDRSSALLGEFLSALKEDKTGASFGKQT